MQKKVNKSYLIILTGNLLIDQMQTHKCVNALVKPFIECGYFESSF